MSDSTNNPAGAVRCVSCGHVAVPIIRARRPGWVALSIWAAAGAVWALGFAIDAAWPSFVAAVVFLGAMIYTLLYFFSREQACRECGGRDLDSATGATAP